MRQVSILMCTHNGERFLAEQLQSILNQDYPNWDLWVSDDSSSDKTREILENFDRTTDVGVKIFSGPGKGASANFLSLLNNPKIPTGWVALSDQDDIWSPNKISSDVHLLSSVPKDVPSLVCRRTLIIDSKGKPVRLSRSPRSICFENSIVQNVVSGNTILMNSSAHELIRRAGSPPVPFHDWWIYLLIMSAGGKIIYNLEPTTFYRSHGENSMGENQSLGAKFLRAKYFAGGIWRGWFEQNMAALLQNFDLLEPRVQSRLEKFYSYDRSCRFGQTLALLSLGAYRQRRIETISLYIGAALGIS